MRRAKNRIVECTNLLRYQQFSRVPGQLPRPLEAVVASFKRRDLVTMRRLLQASATEFAECAHYHLLQGWLARAENDLATAQRHLHRALVFADDGVVRAKVLNTLGNVHDAVGDDAAARRSWSRAHRLDPNAPVPLLNLLANASERKDLADCQFYLQRLGDLRAKKKLTAQQQTFVVERLRDNPEFSWVRRTAPWRRGPAAWIKKLALRTTAPLLGLFFAVAHMGGAVGCDGAVYSDDGSTTEVVVSALTAASAIGSAATTCEIVRDADVFVATESGALLDVERVDASCDHEGLLDAWIELGSVASRALGEAGATLVFVSNHDIALDITMDWRMPVAQARLMQPVLYAVAQVEVDGMLGKDDYIRPATGGTTSKDDYIRPATQEHHNNIEERANRLSKDDYIQPCDEDDE